MSSNKYENEFEAIRDRSIVISDLIGEILSVEEIIVRHRAAGSTGFELEQYIERQKGFEDSLNEHLGPHHFAFVRKEAA